MIVFDEARTDCYDTPADECDSQYGVRAVSFDGHYPGSFEDDVGYVEEVRDVAEVVAGEFEVCLEAEEAGVS